MHDALSIHAAALEAPRRVALSAHGTSYTFAELADLASERSHRIAAQPALTVIAERTLETAVLLYAALAERVPVVLMHARSTLEERAHMTAGAADLREHPERSDIAAVTFTSGSSGAPKGVLLGRAAFVASAAASASHLGWRPHDRWLCCLPLAHIGGLSILTRCLIARATTALAPETRFDATAIIRQLAAERITLLSLVPAMLAAMLDAGWTPSAHLRAVLLGGAAAPQALLDRAAHAGVPILLTYGMSETCSQIATQAPNSGPPVAGRVGQPLPGAQIAVRDGRVHVRGPVLMRGYLGAPAPIDADGWLDTGDRGYLDAQGDLHVLGRADHTIITGGENVDPVELEDVLLQHPEIASACVFPVPDATYGQLVAAAIVPRSPALALPALADFLATRLASYKRPRLVALASELPHGPSGKLDRPRVPALVAAALQPLTYR